MKKILCYTGAVAILVVGLLPAVKIIQQTKQDARMSYDDYAYFDFNAILSVIISLGSVAGAVILFWIGRRQKAK